MSWGRACPLGNWEIKSPMTWPFHSEFQCSSSALSLPSLPCIHIWTAFFFQVGRKGMDLWEPALAEACRLLLTLEEQQWHRRRRDNAECRKMYKSCLSLFFLFAESPQIWSQKKAWDKPKIDLKLAWNTDLHFLSNRLKREVFVSNRSKGKVFHQKWGAFF